MLQRIHRPLAAPQATIQSAAMMSGSMCDEHVFTYSRISVVRDPFVCKVSSTFSPTSISPQQ